MGREVRRVPLDFDWPLEKTWKGFINPHYVPCPDCVSGQTMEGWALQRLVHLMIVIGGDSLRRPKDFVKTPGRCQVLNENGVQVNYPHPWTVNAGIDDPGSKFHELVMGLTKEKDRSRVFGLGSRAQYDIMKRLLKAAKLKLEWLTCKTCGGEGVHPDHQQAYDAWEDYPPPEGEGWQLWETVSEGSPITRVFKTPEGLAQCIAEGGGRPLGDPPSYENALAFVKEGWAPSMVITPTHGIEDGITHAGRTSQKRTQDTPT